MHEFNKALLADPENVKARKYVDKLTGKSKDMLKLKEAKEIKIKESALSTGSLRGEAEGRPALSIPSPGEPLPVAEEPATALPFKKRKPPEESRGFNRSARVRAGRACFSQSRAKKNRI